MAAIKIGNIRGPKGDVGTSLKILGYFNTEQELFEFATSPAVGDTYGVGSAAPYDIYTYSELNGWVNNGAFQPDINEQTPNYDEATELVTLSSGEAIKIAFGKIAKAIKDLISHIADSVKHITADERTAWNGKANITGDAFTGNVSIVKNQLPSLYLTSGKAMSQIYRVANDNSEDGIWIRDMSNINDTTKYVAIRISHGKSNIKDSVCFMDGRDGTSIPYRLYGEHNKPTANDVGAIAKQVEFNGKDVLGITDDGFYYCVNATNVPTTTTAGYLRVVVADTKHRKVCWHPSNSITEYVNVLSNGTWLGWRKILTEPV